MVPKRRYARRIEPIDPTRSRGSLDDKAGILEHLQMLGHGWPADRKPVSELADRERAPREVLNDRPAGAITEHGPFVVPMVSLHER